MTIYTAIFGDYDILKEPTYVTGGWKYVCYTNNKNLTSDVWEIRYIKNKNLSDKMAARCIKIRFFDYIKDDLVVWCDASMQINCDLNEFIKQKHMGDFTLMMHPVRKCTYEEGLACISLGKDNYVNVDEQMAFYKSKGFPPNQGMVQTGLMVRNNNKNVKQFCKMWYEQVDRFSHRDQLSFNYVVWKTNLIKPFLISSMILNNAFKLYKHK